MRIRSRGRRLLAGLAAALLLLVAVDAASARNLSVTEPAFRAVWSPMSIVQRPSGVIIRCPITLEGSFQSASFMKIRGRQVGQVTSATSATCTGGSLTILRETLPWRLNYRTFTGTLPNITTVVFELVGLSFQTNVLGFPCLFRSTAENPVNQIARVEASAIAGLTIDETILLRSSTFQCEMQSLGLSGSATVTRPGSTTAIFIRLI